MQLQKIIPLRNFKNFLQLQLHDLMDLNLTCNDSERNGKLFRV